MQRDMRWLLCVRAQQQGYKLPSKRRCDGFDNRIIILLLLMSWRRSNFNKWARSCTEQWGPSPNMSSCIWGSPRRCGLWQVDKVSMLKPSKQPLLQSPSTQILQQAMAWVVTVACSRAVTQQRKHNGQILAYERLLARRMNVVLTWLTFSMPSLIFSYLTNAPSAFCLFRLRDSVLIFRIPGPWSAQGTYHKGNIVQRRESELL